MFTQQELSLHKWTDVSITENSLSSRSTLITLIFPTNEEATLFYELVLAKCHCRFSAILNKTTRKYVFWLAFQNSDYVMELHSNYRHPSYYPITWLSKDRNIYITTGTRPRKGVVRYYKKWSPLEDWKVH